MPGIVVFGVTGRMGQALVRALREEAATRAAGAAARHDGPAGTEFAPGAATAGNAIGHNAPEVEAAAWRLSGAVASSQSSRLGQDAAIEGASSGVTVTADAALALAGAAVAVDFSLAACVAANAEACARAGVPLLVGTTGFDGTARQALEAAAAVIPVLIAPNTSVGVNVVAKLVKMATLALGAGYDVEISEAHHRQKRDAPSGTALKLGEAVASARGQRLSDVAVFARHGALAPRAAADIGFNVVRAGDIVGEHTVCFAIAGERVEITHRATDRMMFARGALRAAEWLEGRPPGLYGMDDVLGLVKA